MKNNKYIKKIQHFLAERHPGPIRRRRLAQLMGVPDDEYRQFRSAVKTMRETGRLVSGAKNALMLPDRASKVVGHYQSNPRGFGFVIPETPDTGQDLYIPHGADRGAITGDLVVARITKQGRRHGKSSFSGEVIEILERGMSRFVGTLEQSGNTWLVYPDGKKMTDPVELIKRPSAKALPGDKVVIEFKQIEDQREIPPATVVELIGPSGELANETVAIIRQYEFADRFGEAALKEAKRVADAFDGEGAVGTESHREDLTELLVVTIDPPDAKDFDDAISLVDNPDGTRTLGVHIADVAAFVPEGGALDREARARGTSVYFPKRVVPMLPEILSNGVCSLKEGEPRLAKSVFITYSKRGAVLDRRFSESVITSAKRLTYDQAQQIVDRRTRGFDKLVVNLVRRAATLARAIDRRRTKAGQLHLDLREVHLLFDEQHRIRGAEPATHNFAHTIIEMFMIEANEAVAALFAELKIPIIRRNHPQPDTARYEQLGEFVRACGYQLPAEPTMADLQQLIKAVEQTPHVNAVNIAILRTFQQAVYGIEIERHFALASAHYCHFTSPIRRYPDLVVHRRLRDHLRGKLKRPNEKAVTALAELATHCTETERAAATAELELKQVLVLQHLQGKLGETFEGTITGVIEFGVFVQLQQFMVDGLVRLQDLGEDYFDVQPEAGIVRGEHTGVTHRIGDVVQVQIIGINVARRQLELAMK